MVDRCFENIDGKRVLDISIGSFRISKEYLKRMRKNNPNSQVLSYPFSCENGVYSYGDEKVKKMVEIVKKQVKKYVSEEKIYTTI